MYIYTQYLTILSRLTMLNHLSHFRQHLTWCFRSQQPASRVCREKRGHHNEPNALAGRFFQLCTSEMVETTRTITRNISKFMIPKLQKPTGLIVVVDRGNNSVQLTTFTSNNFKHTQQPATLPPHQRCRVCGVHFRRAAIQASCFFRIKSCNDMANVVLRRPPASGTAVLQE